jgi:hypothetical protein
MGISGPISRINKKRNRMLQTETKKRYAKETLILLPGNESYDAAHRLTEDDVDKVNSLVERIESIRLAEKPKAGDRLLYTSKYGDYSPVAFIEKNREGELYVCIKPMVPFVWTNEDCIYYDVSGGPFAGMHESKLEYAGISSYNFKTWGHNGMRANGAVYFKAEVSVWEYIEPEPLFGNFTTKTWRKITLKKTKDSATEYLYAGDGFAFRDESEYLNFLQTFCGTEFPGYWDNQLIVWCYRDEFKDLPLQHWEAINAPVTTRIIGTLPTNVKVQKDHENHKVITFFVRPE